MSRATAFSPTANPDAYVPGAGAERALGALRHWGFDSRRPVVLLVGAPGTGKTLLLKVFAARARERGGLRPIYIPNPDCDAADFCRWVLRDLEPEAGDDPRAALTGATDALRAEGDALLLLVDEAESLPQITADWLFDAARASDGGIRLLLAFTDETRREETATRLGADATTVRIDTHLSRAEVEAYIRSELERAEVEPALRACFDDATIDALHVRSAGVPALLQNEAASILFRAEIPRGAIGRGGAVAPRLDATAELRTFAALTAHANQPASASTVHADAAEAVAKARSAMTSAQATEPRPSRRLRTLRTGWWAGLACGTALGLIAALSLSQWRSSSAGGAVSAAPPTSPSPSVSSASPDRGADASIDRAATAPADSHASPVGDGGTLPIAEVMAPPPPSSASAPVQLANAAPSTPDEAALPRIASPPTVAAEPVLVSINAEPWAVIEIDGRPAGETPTAGIRLLPGRHRFAARMPDGRTDERVVDVDASNRRIVFR